MQITSSLAALTFPDTRKRLVSGIVTVFLVSAGLVASTSVPSNAASDAAISTTPSGVEASAATATTTDRLLPGQSLSVGDKLVSQNKQYRAAVDSGGNFVVRDASNKVMWTSGTQGNGPTTAVYLHGDGEIIIFRKDTMRNVYQAGTHGTGQGHRLIMRNDGRLVLTTIGGT